MANRYFLNIGTDPESNANWSTTSGGAGGASKPTSSDIAIFDGNSGNCNLTANINWQGISLAAGYANVFTQGNFEIVYGSGHITQVAGTFTGSNTSKKIEGSSGSKFIQSGGVFTSTNGVLTVGVAGIGIYSLDITGGQFNHNSGKVLIKGSNHTACRNLIAYPLNNFEVDACPTCTISGAIYVDGEAKATNNNWATAGSLVVNLKGNYIAVAGAFAVTMIGTGNQDFDVATGIVTGQVTINKPSGNMNVIRDFAWYGNWIHTAGTIVWNSKKAIARFLNNGFSITNGSFHHLEQNSTSGVSIGTVGNPIQCEGDFILNGQAGTNSFPAVKFKGNLSILTANGTCAGATFNGTGSQSFTSAVSQYNVPIDINKPSGVVTLMSNFEMLGSTNDLNIILGQFNQNGFNFKTQDTINITGGQHDQGTGSLDCGRFVNSGGIFNEGIQGIILRGIDFLISGAGVFNRNLVGGGIFANNAVATALNVNTNGWEISVFKFARLTQSLTLLASLVVAKDFEKTSTATTANVIGGGFMVRIGGNYKQNNQYSSRALATSPTWILNGAGDQEVFAFDGKFDSGNWRVDKPSGKVIQTSHVTIDNGQAGDNGLNSLLVFKGIWCTNQYNLTVDDDIVISGLGEIDKTPSSVITGTVVGTITNVSDCSQKKTNFFAYLTP